MQSTLVRGVQVFDGERWIPEGYVVVRGNRISHMGEGAAPRELVEECGRDMAFSPGEYLLMPGLVNAHTHVGMGLLRGVADDVPFEKWLFEEILPRENRMNGDDVYFSGLLSQMEMARKGITLFLDMYMFPQRVAQAVHEFGMRAAITRGLVDEEVERFGETTRLQENIELFEKWNGADGGRITVGFGPHSPYACSFELLETVARVVRDFGSFVNIHIRESARERQQYEISRVAQSGIFDVPCFAAHCVHLSEEDMKLMAEKGVWIVHNPSSNLKLANGIAPVARMLENGCKVLLGTDSVASNNSLDIWREMLLTALVQKGFFHDPTLLPASRVLQMAGPDAYQAMGFPDGGILKPGNLADMVLLELHPIDFFPPEQLLSHLVYSGGSAHVFATMVDGKWVYYEGAFPTIDADEVFSYLGPRNEALREK